MGCTITYGWLQGAKEPGHPDRTRVPAPGTRAAPGHQDTRTRQPHRTRAPHPARAPARVPLPYSNGPLKPRRICWSVSTISAYMQTTRATIYDILKRWATEGQAGLEDKSHAPTRPARKVTFQEIQEVRRLARNPDIGAYRVRAALEQIGIKLLQRTCGRLLELNRKLYGLEKSKGDATGLVRGACPGKSSGGRNGISFPPPGGGARRERARVRRMVGKQADQDGD